MFSARLCKCCKETKCLKKMYVRNVLAGGRGEARLCRGCCFTTSFLKTCWWNWQHPQPIGKQDAVALQPSWVLHVPCRETHCRNPARGCWRVYVGWAGEEPEAGVQCMRNDRHKCLKNKVFRSGHLCVCVREFTVLEVSAHLASPGGTCPTTHRNPQLIYFRSESALN